MTTVHYHTGYGLAGYGPDMGDDNIRRVLATVIDAAEDIAEELRNVADQLTEDGDGFRADAREARGDGSPSTVLVEEWETVGIAALYALEAYERADDAMALRSTLLAGVKHGDEPRLRRYLLNAERAYFPLPTQVRGSSQLYVWPCETWQCRVSDFDAEFIGGYTASMSSVFCICRDCPEVLSWSAGEGVAPYCHRCADADCFDRMGGHCDREDDDEDGEADHG